MIEKIEGLSINDLDVQELENRLEMTMVEAEAGGWIRIVTDPPPPKCVPGVNIPGCV